MEKVKSCMFKLYELRDEMKQAIEANDTVIRQQIELANIVEKAEKKEDFTDFIKGLKDQIKDYEKQREKLVNRVELIAGIISKYEEENKNGDCNTDGLVTWLLLALGVCPFESEEGAE